MLLLVRCGLKPWEVDVLDPDFLTEVIEYMNADADHRAPPQPGQPITKG